MPMTEKWRNRIMTNAEIISVERAMHNITEDLHTFAMWKKLGYMVKKGEHAVVETRLWKMRTKKTKEKEEALDEEMVESENKKFFLAKAFLFSESQVEKIV